MAHSSGLGGQVSTHLPTSARYSSSPDSVVKLLLLNLEVLRDRSTLGRGELSELATCACNTWVGGQRQNF